MGAKSITTRRTGSTYACDVAIRDHNLVLDEPVHLDGSNLGPTPVELVTAALGSCTAITMQMYARRKGWTISRLEISVDHETINAPAATLEGRIAKQDRFQMRILLEGELDETQRTRLFEVGERCPVHRMLAGTPIVVSEYADPVVFGSE